MDEDVFSIQLLPAKPDEETLGEIRVNDFVEKFAVESILERVDQFTQLWNESLNLLLGGEKAVALPASPMMTWVLYRDKDLVHVQQSLILPGTGMRLLPSGRIENIPGHLETNDEGNSISQWTTSVKAVERFLRMQSQP